MSSNVNFFVGDVSMEPLSWNMFLPCPMLLPVLAQKCCCWSKKRRKAVTVKLKKTWFDNRSIWKWFNLHKKTTRNWWEKHLGLSSLGEWVSVIKHSNNQVTGLTDQPHLNIYLETITMKLIARKVVLKVLTCLTYFWQIQNFEVILTGKKNQSAN